MTNNAGAFQPAIDALEKDLADLERQANALLTGINLLRSKAGLPPRPGGGGGWSTPTGDGSGAEGAARQLTTIHSDTFLGKRMGSAAREYLEMRKAAGGDAPATVREMFDALKSGGFVFGSKDEGTALVVLRAMLRKNTQQFYKLDNGKYGLRVWYPHVPKPKKGATAEAANEGDDDVDELGMKPSDKADKKDAA